MTFTENPRLVHVLSQLIGRDMYVINSMFINKPPGSQPHPPHQVRATDARQPRGERTAFAQAIITLPHGNVSMEDIAVLARSTVTVLVEKVIGLIFETQVSIRSRLFGFLGYFSDDISVYVSVNLIQFWTA